MTCDSCGEPASVFAQRFDGNRMWFWWCRDCEVVLGRHPGCYLPPAPGRKRKKERVL